MGVNIMIPMYNVQGYLGECLDSVLVQTHKSLRAVVVNDGSSDGSLDVAKRYLYDPRIILIDKKHTGLSRSRNILLDFIFSRFFDIDFDHIYIPASLFTSYAPGSFAHAFTDPNAGSTGGSRRPYLGISSPGSIIHRYSTSGSAGDSYQPSVLTSADSYAVDEYPIHYHPLEGLDHLDDDFPGLRQCLNSTGGGGGSSGYSHSQSGPQSLGDLACDSPSWYAIRDASDCVYVKISSSQLRSSSFAPLRIFLRRMNDSMNYGIFIDSDDYLTVDAIKRLRDVLDENGTEASSCGCFFFDDEGYCYENLEPVAKISSADYMKSYSGNCFSAAIGVLAHMRLFRGLRFIPDILNEDCPFGVDLFMQEFQFSILCDVHYMKRVRLGSISHVGSFNDAGYERIKYTFLMISEHVARRMDSVRDRRLRRSLADVVSYNVNGLVLYHIISGDRNLSRIWRFFTFVKPRHYLWILSPRAYSIVKFARDSLLKLRRSVI